MFVRKLEKKEWRELDDVGKMNELLRIANDYFKIYSDDKVPGALGQGRRYYKAYLRKKWELEGVRPCASVAHFDREDWREFQKDLVEPYTKILEALAEIGNACRDNGFRFTPSAHLSFDYLIDTLAEIEGQQLIVLPSEKSMLF